MNKIVVALVTFISASVHAQVGDLAVVTYGYSTGINCAIGSGFPYTTSQAAASAGMTAVASCNASDPRKRNYSFVSSPLHGGMANYTYQRCSVFSTETNACTGNWDTLNGSFTIIASPACANTSFQAVLENGVYYCRPSACFPAGTPSTLSWDTTIRGYTLNGTIISDGAPSNPQCKANCRVQHATGGVGLQGTAYFPPGGNTIGSPIHAVIEIDVTYTGDFCNIAGTSTFGEWTDRPATFTQTQGNDDGDGDTGGNTGRFDEQIAQSSAQIATSVGGIGGRLDTIANNIVLADNNTEARHTSLMARLGSMLDALNSIDGKTADNGTGTGGNGGSQNGTGTITGNSDIGDIAIYIEHPEGGLKAPGEAGLQSLLSGSGITREAGLCPTWTFDIEYLGIAPVLDAHCTLWANNAATLELLFSAMWILAGLYIVLSA